MQVSSIAYLAYSTCEEGPRYQTHLQNGQSFTSDARCQSRGRIMRDGCEDHTSSSPLNHLHSFNLGRRQQFLKVFSIILTTPTVSLYLHSRPLLAQAEINLLFLSEGQEEKHGESQIKYIR